MKSCVVVGCFVLVCCASQSASAVRMTFFPFGQYLAAGTLVTTTVEEGAVSQPQGLPPVVPVCTPPVTFLPPNQKPTETSAAGFAGLALRLIVADKTPSVPSIFDSALPSVNVYEYIMR